MGARGENDFKLVQINLERIWRKEIQKKGKGQALLGQPRFPFGPASGPACSPFLSLPHARRPPRSTRRRPRGGRPPTPLVGTSARAPRPFPLFCPPRPPSPSSLRSHRVAAAAPPRAIAGESPAARRRPHQSLKLTVESTSAFVIVRVSLCARSTEVRVRRAL